MTTEKKKGKEDIRANMPSAEEVARELGQATSIDDFYGKFLLSPNFEF